MEAVVIVDALGRADEKGLPYALDRGDTVELTDEEWSKLSSKENHPHWGAVAHPDSALAAYLSEPVRVSLDPDQVRAHLNRLKAEHDAEFLPEAERPAKRGGKKKPRKDKTPPPAEGSAEEEFSPQS